jgi:hypothetical protein
MPQKAAKRATTPPTIHPIMTGHLSDFVRYLGQDSERVSREIFALASSRVHAGIPSRCGLILESVVGITNEKHRHSAE